MSDWKTQYENAADEEAERVSRLSDQQLLDAVARGKTGGYYVIWREIGRRKPTAEACRELFEVLQSDRPYLDRYHCADALLKLLHCTEFEPVDLSAGWPTVPANLARVRALINAKFDATVE